MATTPGGRQGRRWLARACVGAAVGCLVLAGLGSAAAQEPEQAALPDVFRGSASSQVVSAFLDRDALLPVNDAFRFIALDGASTYESSNQTARASILYPGNGVVSGPGLACGTFGGQFPEQFAPILAACTQFNYPLTVFADSLKPDGSTTGSAELGAPSDPVSATGVRAVAHAALDGATTDAAMSELRVLGLPAFGPVELPLPVPGAPELDPSLLVVEAATSTTAQRIDEAGRLVIESEAVLDGVRLVGGLVRIGSIRSMSTVVDDGRGEKSRRAELDISGVTVAGVPAEVTSDGLVVGEPTGADGPLVQQLTSQVNDLVRALGVEVTALEVEDGVDDSGLAFARSAGVLVEFDVDAQGLPVLPGPQGDVDPNGIYTGVIQLGQTGATGLAATIDDPVFSPGGVSTPDAPTGGAADVPAPDLASTPIGNGLDDVTADDGEAAAPAVPDATGQRVVSLSEVLASGRVELVYLAFTLMAFAVCLGPRFLLPARLPGSAP